MYKRKQPRQHIPQLNTSFKVDFELCPIVWSRLERRPVVDGQRRGKIKAKGFFQAREASLNSFSNYICFFNYKFQQPHFIWRRAPYIQNAGPIGSLKACQTLSHGFLILKPFKFQVRFHSLNWTPKYLGCGLRLGSSQFGPVTWIWTWNSKITLIWVLIFATFNFSGLVWVY